MGMELVLCLGVLLGAASAQHPVSSCQDLDTGGCQVFAKANPNLCQEPMFADSTCKRFCGNCPTECYSCSNPLMDPSDCNVTTTCGTDKTCMTKHLHAKDGHHEYILSCESKQICNGLSFGFGILGKRHVIGDVAEVENHERHLYEREVTLDCCDTDYCNMPLQTTTTITTEPPPTTTTPRPTPKPTTVHPTSEPHTTVHPPPEPTTHFAVPTTMKPVTQTCHKDVVFAVDESGSVGSSNFRHMMDFVSQVVSKLNVGQYGAHVAMVTYASTPKVRWYLNRYTTKQQLLSAIHHVPYQSGGTRTDLVLDAIMSSVLTPTHGERRGAENVVVVLTDGKSNQPRLTAAEAQKLHYYSHDIISVGIGSGVDGHELGTIATDRHHVFTTHGFQYLAQLIPNLVNIICN